MAVYDVTQGIPEHLRKGDILNCPYSGSAITLPLPKGVFKLEVWGAQGGLYTTSYTNSGRGGYSTGQLTLNDATTLFLYSGQYPGAGTSSSLTFGNGGGTSNYGGRGGGASDIRIGTDSFYARVIVAGGGGGNGYSSGGNGGGYGGGITGGDGVTGTYAGGGGGTQTAGGSSAAAGQGGEFRLGGSTTAGGGGGGGWYGGGAGRSGGTDSAGGGGSGYVYTADTAANYPVGCLLNSSHYLSEASTVAGNQTITAPDGTQTTGNSGNGYVRITVLNITSYFFKKNGEWMEGTTIYTKQQDTWVETFSVPRNKYGRIVLAQPEITSETIFTYDTNVHGITNKMFMPGYMTATDESSAIPGQHNANYILSDSISKWTDNTSAPKVEVWHIRMSIPSTTSYLYTGSVIIPTWTNYYSDYMTMSGDISGTDVGSYTTTFTLNPGLQWTDGTTEPKTVTWKIVVKFQFITDGVCTTGWELTQGYGPWGSTWANIGHVKSYSYQVSDNAYVIYMACGRWDWGQSTVMMADFIDCTDYDTLKVDASFNCTLDNNVQDGGCYGLGINNESGTLRYVASGSNQNNVTWGRDTATIDVSEQTQIKIFAGGSMNSHHGTAYIYNAWLE